MRAGSPASSVGRIAHVLSISARASCSAWVTVRSQVSLIVIQSMAYWHQWDLFSGRHSFWSPCAFRAVGAGRYGDEMLWIIEVVGVLLPLVG